METPRFITHHEFAPVVQKLEELIVEHAVSGTEVRHLREDVSDLRKDFSDMKLYLKNIDAKMTELVNHKMIHNWIIKATFWAITTILVPGATMMFAHFTGVMKMFNKLIN